MYSAVLRWRKILWRWWRKGQTVDVGWLLLFGTVLALANLSGGILVATMRGDGWRDSALKYLIAIGAGFMLAAIFIEILPETARMHGVPGSVEGTEHGMVDAMTLLLLGYLLIHFFEHTVAPHFHFGPETHTESMLNPGAALTALGGLTIHTFFDGVSIAAAFLVNGRVGMLIFIAILLHKIPEGFTAASITLASGRTKRAALSSTLIIGAATLCGIAAVGLLQTKIDHLVLYALPFSAGVTLYVAASDLIPEVNHASKNPRVSLAVFGGVALFYLLHILIEV